MTIFLRELKMKCTGPPDAGNPHVRWDEGEGARSVLGPLSTLLSLWLSYTEGSMAKIQNSLKTQSN